jgi:hypothetical protein
MIPLESMIHANLGSEAILHPGSFIRFDRIKAGCEDKVKNGSEDVF